MDHFPLMYLQRCRKVASALCVLKVLLVLVSKVTPLRIVTYFALNESTRSWHDMKFRLHCRSLKKQLALLQNCKIFIGVTNTMKKFVSLQMLVLPFKIFIHFTEFFIASVARLVVCKSVFGVNLKNT